MRNETQAFEAAARGGAVVRIPRLWPVVVILATPVLIGLGVFLKRYRGTDRTAMALGVLVGGGLCLIVGLAWFQRRFGGTAMSRQSLRWIGFRWGAVGGACAGGVAVLLLAVRWAIDQLGGPVGEQFGPAFLRALSALWWTTLPGLPAYLAVGVVLGVTIGLAVAEAVGACAARIPGVPLREN
jgi:uncharacterized membrane protein AbrB (regulator of aidB expression)